MLCIDDQTQRPTHIATIDVKTLSERMKLGFHFYERINAAFQCDVSTMVCSHGGVVQHDANELLRRVAQAVAAPPPKPSATA